MEPQPIRLDGATTSIVVDARGPGVPRWIHWGPRLPDGLDLAALCDARERPVPNNALNQDMPPTLLTETGTGAFGRPGLLGSRQSDAGQSSAWATTFQLVALRRDGDTANFELADEAAGLVLALTLALDPATGVVTRKTGLRNAAATPYRLDWLAAGHFPVPVACTEALVFDGQWNGEFAERRIALGQGIYTRENRRGRTSADNFPGLILGRPGFGEAEGAVYGFHLGWSGNHRVAAELTVEAALTVELGELLAPGEVVLQPGETYETPTAYAVFSAAGLNGVSDGFHRFVRRHVPWPGGTMRPRPVHLNTWEAVYFNHDLETLKRLADRAAAVGVERFVLDDGWFRGRDDDTSSLGDWTPDPRKWPHGLAPLIDHVRALGLEFGLWVEPEMINPDSDLYRAHPDWAMQLPGRPPPLGRNQLVLNLTNPTAFAHIHGALDRLLSAGGIDYLKWDMNRDLAPGASGGRPAYRGQTLAVYDLIDRLRTAHPGVEIESCSSGGSRIDLGILGRTHRFWTSDNNDALERQSIQRGFSRFFPPEIMGAHIGPAPSHTTGRSLSLHLRGLTALFGHMGLELNLLDLSGADCADLAFWIGLHKRFRPLLHGGRTVRLDDLRDGRLGHGVVSGDRTEALFAVVQLARNPFRIPAPTRLPGLDPGRAYRVRLAAPAPKGAKLATSFLGALAADGARLDGAALTEVGVQLPPLWPETGLLLHLEAA